MTGPALPPIGERLRRARLDRGMTVRGLARAVDVSASLISQIETGKSSPSVSTLYSITAALGISVEDVFGDADARAARRAADRAVAGDPVGQPRGGVDALDEVAVSAGVRPGVPVARVAGDGPVPVPGTPALTEPIPPALAALGLATVAGPSAAGPSAAGLAAAGPAVAGPAVAGPAVAGPSVAAQGLRMLSHRRRVGPVVPAGEREILHLDSGVSWELLGQLPDTHVDFIRITYQPGGSSSGAGVLMRHTGTEWGHMLSGQLTLTLGFDTYVLNPGDSISFDCTTPHSYANHGTEPAVGVWFVAERFR